MGRYRKPVAVCEAVLAALLLFAPSRARAADDALVAEPEGASIASIAKPIAGQPATPVTSPVVSRPVSGTWVIGHDRVPVYVPNGTRWVRWLDGRVVPLAPGALWVRGRDGHARIMAR